MPPASSCMTTAQPGLSGSPPRPAGRLPAWQRHSEPGPAARTEALVAPPGPNRPGCARSRQGTEFAESRFQQAGSRSCVGRDRTDGRRDLDHVAAARPGRSGHLIAAAISAAPFRPSGKRSERLSWRLVGHETKSAAMLAGRRSGWRTSSPGRRRFRWRQHLSRKFRGHGAAICVRLCWSRVA